MTDDVLIRERRGGLRHRETERGGHVRTEAENVRSQAKECQEPPEAEVMRGREGVSSRVLQGAQPG